MSSSSSSLELRGVDPGDTYRRLSALLYGSENRWEDVRQHALNLVEGHRGVFQEAVEAQAAQYRLASGVHLLEAPVFGSDPIGLEAIALVYQITIQAHRYRSAEPEVYPGHSPTASGMVGLDLAPFRQSSELQPGSVVKITFRRKSVVKSLLTSMFSSWPFMAATSAADQAAEPGVEEEKQGQEDSRQENAHQEQSMDLEAGNRTLQPQDAQPLDGGQSEQLKLVPTAQLELVPTVPMEPVPAAPMEPVPAAQMEQDGDIVDRLSDSASSESPFGRDEITIKPEPARDDGRPRTYPINEIQYALADAETRKVFAILDEIADVLGEELAKEVGLEFPEIVLIGQESAGKSSVLERIAMLPIFPRGEGIVTRMPIRLQLTRAHGKQELAAFCRANGELQFDERGFYFRAAVIDQDHRPTDYDWTPWYGPVSGNTVLDNFEADVPVARVMQEAIRNPTGESMGVNEQQVILVEIVSTQVPNIRLVDLPGIVGASLEGEPLDMAERTERLVNKYLQRQDSLVVIVVEATSSSVRNSKAFQLAQHAGKIGQAVGVLTKSDMCTDHYLGMLRRRLKGEAADCPKLEYGYVAVKNRGHERTPLREAAETEHKFFMEKLPDCAETNQQLVGIGALLHHLRQMLTQYTRRRWAPDTKRRVHRHLRAREAELSELGTPVPSIEHEKPLFMQAIAATLMARCRQVLGVGTPEDTAGAPLFEECMRCMDTVDMREQLQVAALHLGLPAIGEVPAFDENTSLDFYEAELARRYSATCLLALYTQTQSAVFQHTIEVIQRMCAEDGVIAALAMAAMRAVDPSPDRIHRFHQLHELLASRLARGVQARLPSLEELQRNIERLCHATPPALYEAVGQGSDWRNHMQSTARQFIFTTITTAVVGASCDNDVFSIEHMLRDEVPLDLICIEDEETATNRARLNRARDILRRCEEHIRLIIPDASRLTPSSLNDQEVIVIDDEGDADEDGDADEPEQKRSRT